MARTATSPIYSKLSRLEARGSFKLSLVLTAAGLVCLVVSGFVWYVKVFLGLALLFLFDTALELANALFIESKKRNKKTSRMPLKGEFVPNTDFEYISTKDEGAWFERRILIDGHPLRIQIPPRILSTVKPKADELIATLGELVSKFQLFKSLEAERNPQFAKEIKNLEIERLYFVSKKQPGLLELIFTEESGGEPWIALWDQDRREFRDLRLET